MSASRQSLLVLDDDEDIRTQYKWLLSAYETIPAGSREAALRAFSEERPAVAIVDLGLPPDRDGASEGLEAVQQLLQIAPQTKIIVVTGNDDREHAARAVGYGAYDFLRKPVDPDHLVLAVERAFRLHELEQENQRLSAISSHSPIAGIIGSSPQLGKILRDVERISKTDIAVLILGESGTGKELIANAIHRLSSRAKKPFVPLNCAAIPEGLLEAELFGHEKGAFTGAIRQSIGKIEGAQQGTLFLDEIGDIPLSVQVKLLRFLEDQVIERVGGRQKIKINTRVLCATNQNLGKLIDDGRFREDLYYRINGITLQMPPLRDRHGDAVVLAHYFLKKYAKQFDRSLKGFSATALAAISKDAWRGNVRELESKVKRAVVMSEGPLVDAVDLELTAADATFSLDLREARRRAEYETIKMALAQSDGNISNAAKFLGISRPTLYDLLQEHRIEFRSRDAVETDTEKSKEVRGIK